MNNLENLQEITSFAAQIKELDKRPEVTLLFGEKEHPVKFKKRISAYIVENAIDILNDRDYYSIDKCKNKYLSAIAKKSEGKEQDEIEKILASYYEKNPDEVYSLKEIMSALHDPENFYDKSYNRKARKMNVLIFKLIIDDLQDAKAEKYTEKEIEMLHSDHDSTFWQEQDGKEIEDAVNYFRAKNKIGIRLL